MTENNIENIRPSGIKKASVGTNAIVKPTTPQPKPIIKGVGGNNIIPVQPKSK